MRPDVTEKRHQGSAASGRLITVAGEALIDLIVDARGRVRPSPGGGAFNTARTIARLGQPVTFLGRLSGDRFGCGLADLLAADGVRLQVPADAGEPTTLAVLDIDPAGVASYRFYLSGTAAAALSRAEVPAGTAALHIGTLSLIMEPIASTIEELVRSLPDTALLMLDPNCRPSAIGDKEAYLARLARLLPRADVVKASAEDLAYLSAPASCVPGLLSGGPAGLLSGGPGAVVVTDGAADVRVFTADGQVTSTNVPPVDVVDTVGAGDAFGGAFLAWWVGNGLTRAGVGKSELVTAATVAAVAAAAITCTRTGAEPPWRTELHGKPGWSAP